MGEAPVVVVTYDDSSAGHVSPVSTEAAQAAFQNACSSSFQRREDVTHPEHHVCKSGIATDALNIDWC